MPSDRVPIVILGGGCAGLSLAIHLSSLGLDDDIVIVEPRTRSEYLNDKTWCGFSTRNTIFDQIANVSWKSWLIEGETDRLRHVNSKYCYQRIASADFYQHCFDSLAQNLRVSIVFGATDISCHGQRVEFTPPAQNGNVQPSRTVLASHVFDSRPVLPLDLRGRPQDVLLWQQFVGLEVETDHDVFDPDSAVLMDFRTPQRGAIHFMYVLPISKRKALVEATGFVQEPAPFGPYQDDVARYLGRAHGLGPGDWRECRREQGIIPMTTARLERHPYPGVTRIGVAGGAAKPSTGYAFAAIQQHSRRIAESLVKGTLDDRLPGRLVSLLLDQVFLSYLSKYPSRAPELFLRIARGTSPDRFARFMMNHGDWRDDLAVIAAMPKWPFIVEAFRSRAIWAGRRKKGGRGPKAASTPSASETKVQLPSALP